MKNDNIAAIATAAGAAGVAVIRISGDNPLSVAEKVFKPSGNVTVKNFLPNFMYTGEISGDGFSDFGLCVYFKSPKSFTGEDTVELHSHGGIAVTQGILKRVLESGARLAGRGEFTKRAFLNGKLSLASAEGLIEMINSRSVSGVKAGYSLYRERLTRKVSALQENLLAALSQIDADMDFPEEGLTETSRVEVKTSLDNAVKEISALMGTFKNGRTFVRGVKAAICGKPNVGKSSLLNAIIDCDKAIVTEVAGTTRDVVEGVAEINGVLFTFFDTAGIRESDDEIEKIGVTLSKKTLAESDIVLFVLSAEGTDEEDEKVYDIIKDYPHITVVNKTDKFGYKDARADLMVSAKENAGIDALRAAVFDKTVGKVDINADFLCEERHFYALKNALERLTAAAEATESVPLDILSVDILAGWRYLGEITGKTASEDIIDDIFSRFCVGK